MLSARVQPTAARLSQTAEVVSRRSFSFSIFKKLTGRDTVQESEAAFKAHTDRQTATKVVEKAAPAPAAAKAAPGDKDGLKMAPVPRPSYMKSEYFAKEQSLFGHDF